MKKSLVFVESETKKRTIQGFLGENFIVLATSGHICNLKNSGKYNLGVNLTNFSPEYEILKHKKKKVLQWKKLLREENFETIYLGTDPDREGERIAEDLNEQLNIKNKSKRLFFYEITPNSIKKALDESGKINEGLVEAQTARQVLDKMIGFCISPILNKAIKRAFSAGRVQSVVLKMIVEKEDEITEYKKNKKKEYTIVGVLKEEGIKIKEIDKEKNLKLYLEEKEALQNIEQFKSSLNIIERSEEPKTLMPKLPFTTSTLLFESKQNLGFSIEQTTKTAQKLYEGIFLDNEKKNIGLITYPRTDSIRINDSFIKSGYAHIIEIWGKEYCNFSPHWKQQKVKHSQEAHESIRPTYLSIDPEVIKNNITSEEYALYKLIYNNTLASLMAPAKILKKTYILSFDDKKKFLFIANEQIIKFSGFLSANIDFFPRKFFVKQKSDLENLEQVNIDNWDAVEYEINKPIMYDEGTMVKELEKQGIGRPSTYNTFGRTLITRKYVTLNKFNGRFFPLELGRRVNEWLQLHFSTIINQNYTAFLEEKLDEISQKNNSYINFIGNFWSELSSKINPFIE